MRKRQVAVLLADGFEEIEAVTIIDVLRRAGVPTVLAGVGNVPVAKGAHAIDLAVEVDVERLMPEDFAAVILPGGMPGAQNLAESRAVKRLLRDVHKNGALVAAICAAPIALAAAGLLNGRRVTSYPSVREKLGKSEHTGKAVEKDGRVLTGSGPGTALEFAYAIVSELGMEDKAEELRAAMLAPRLGS